MADKVIDLAKCQQKTIAQLTMMDNGVDALTALQLTNNKQQISPVTKYKLEKKYQRYSLLSTAMRKMAHNAVKDCLSDAPIIQKRKDRQGNEIIEEIPPTWTNKIAAASMVYDRVEPAIRQNQNLNVNVDVHPVDLSLYLNSQKSVPQPE